MKFRIDKKYLYWGLTLFLVIMASFCCYFMIFSSAKFRTSVSSVIKICMPVIDGLILAYLLTPVLNTIEKKIIFPICKKVKLEITPKRKKNIRGLALVLTLVVVLLLIYWFFSLIIPQIVKSIQSIILQFPIYLDNLSTWLGKLLSDNPDIEATVNDLIDQYSGKLEDWINQSMMPKINEIVKMLSLSILNFLKGMWNLIIGFIISIYVLGSKEQFAGQSKKVIFSIFSEKYANKFIDDFRFAHKTFSGFLIGKIIDSFIIGCICFVVTKIMGTPYGFLVSIIVGVTNIIPFFGPYLGAIPSTILILMVDPMKALSFVIFIIILQQLDGNVIGPKILGNSTGLSGFWVIFAITLFGGLFGIGGMLVGVPIFAVIYAAIRAYVGLNLKKKGLPTDTKSYLDVSYIENKELIKMDPNMDKKDYGARAFGKHLLDDEFPNGKMLSKDMESNENDDYAEDEE